jgi:7,8-dihydro-6-hydroxymethylpterin dimethyltransferase
MAEPRRSTESLCPVCLRAVPANLLAEEDTVVLEGRCPDHGVWQTPVWYGPPSMDSWCGDTYLAEAGSDEAAGAESKDSDCPGSCGLCPRHQQHTCTAVIEVTRRCDLNCPVCFAESSPGAEGADPSLDQLQEMFRGLFEAQGAANVQLSGGEPTMRDDLPEVIGAARSAGFTFVQLNTNGLRLAAEAGYAEELREAGLSSVFLQFDGITDATYLALRGRPLAARKLQALEQCAQTGLGVVLVPTVAPGVNDHEIGSLVRLATQWPKVVRGLHLQPVSYFGRYVNGDRPRLTLPDALRLLESQTGGEVRVSDFAPSCCEHVRCSFRARYWVRDNGRLELVRSAKSCCSPKPGSAAQRAIAATSRQWSRRSSQEAENADDREAATSDGLNRFLDEADRILCISGMLFQDAWSVDLERVRRCCVHVVTPDRGLVPFCLWNLTSESGQRLYPRY